MTAYPTSPRVAKSNNQNSVLNYENWGHNYDVNLDEHNLLSILDYYTILCVFGIKDLKVRFGQKCFTV